MRTGVVDATEIAQTCWRGFQRCSAMLILQHGEDALDKGKGDWTLRVDDTKDVLQ